MRKNTQHLQYNIDVGRMFCGWLNAILICRISLAWEVNLMRYINSHFTLYLLTYLFSRDAVVLPVVFFVRLQLPESDSNVWKPSIKIIKY